MTTKRFEEIKATIAEAKNKVARAEGQQETLLAQWKRDFGGTSLSDAKKQLAGLEKKYEEKSARLDELTEQLEAAADWDNL
jgi:septal ring factor EnvC (AmiA/AmiB activator)